MSDIFENLVGRYPVLEPIRGNVEAMARMIIETYENGGRVFVAGNGGSCADADHIAGELLKSFKIRRGISREERKILADRFGEPGEKLGSMLEPAFPCVTLHSQIGFVTAFWNDVGADCVFAQQLYAQSRAGDLFIGISTGGNSENICNALMAASLKEVKSVLLTGNKHGKCEKFADLVVAAPESETYKIQELHLPIYHAVCLAVEEHFHGGK